MSDSVSKQLLSGRANAELYAVGSSCASRLADSGCFKFCVLVLVESQGKVSMAERMAARKACAEPDFLQFNDLGCETVGGKVSHHEYVHAAAVGRFTHSTHYNCLKPQPDMKTM